MGAHKSTVNDISFDQTVEYVASCSDDGTVVVRAQQCLSVLRYEATQKSCCFSLTSLLQVQGLYTDELSRYHYRRPVKVSRATLLML